MTAGARSGAAPATGVSPESLVAESAAPVGFAAAAQLPLALALVALSTPAPAPVGATAHGSIEAPTAAPTLDRDASAMADPSVGAVTSGVDATAPATCGSSAMIGATSTSSAVAAGLETSGIELVVAEAPTAASVMGAEVSGKLTLASAVDGAETVGSATVVLPTAAGGWGLVGCGGVVLALAPVVLADAVVDDPAPGLDTFALAGADPLGLAETEAAAPPPGGLTVTELGAFTCGFAFTGEDGTCATADGMTTALIRQKITVSSAVVRQIGSRGIPDLLP